jgi:lipopolysaccharide transport system ATP-binding protein
MKPIIEVNHVWKEYQKGIDRKYKSLRDTIAGIPGRWLGEDKEKFWALEDIDFKVEAGESVGIIGRNGAGKSTLLKILSRITPPTKGEIILRGRVASLLEVGTGFHPELTGRENVFFNGSILGMKHAEIKRKFDEIVDFSGVESFIDTPLKHFSSGMQMRLAFSVAAHLDAEILLIDEVLAVGDAEFQKKCIGKMDEVSKGEGKTILFVSHDFSNLSKICTLGIILGSGRLILKDLISEAMNNYINKSELNHFTFPIHGKKIVIDNFGFDRMFLQKVINVPLGESLTAYFNFLISDYIDGLTMALDIRNNKSELMAHIINDDDYFDLNFNIQRKKHFSLTLKNINFITGTYFIDIWLGKYHSETLIRVERCLKINIISSDKLKRRSQLPQHSKVFIESNWQYYDN